MSVPYRYVPYRSFKIPLYGSAVSAGFPSPADDHIEACLDLNELVITNPPATFFVRASGDSMAGVGIFDGDVLVVDRSIRGSSSSGTKTHAKR
ncbi:MAG: S24 family peptidase [Phormidesmis sp.]